MPRVVPSQVIDVIDTLYPKAKTEVEGQTQELTWDDAPKLLTIFELANKVPDQLLVMPAERYAEYVASLGTIHWFLGRWQSTERVSVNYSRPFRNIAGLRQLGAVSLIRQALAQCPDDFPAANTAELNFITNALSFRENLRLDMSAVNAPLTNDEWKAATVLAGSVVEALLLWALERKTPQEISAATAQLNRKPYSDIQRWNLADYIDVAEVLTRIKPETTSQCRLAKNFRNLIHPGRAQRLGQPCKRGTALSAVAAIEHVVNDLAH